MKKDKFKTNKFAKKLKAENERKEILESADQVKSYSKYGNDNNLNFSIFPSLSGIAVGLMLGIMVATPTIISMCN